MANERGFLTITTVAEPNGGDPAVYLRLQSASYEEVVTVKVDLRAFAKALFGAAIQKVTYRLSR